jgi:protein phosphatase
MTQASADDSRSPDAAPLPALAVSSHGLTDRGRVRDSNEDNFLVGELARTLWVHQSSLPERHTQHARTRNRAYVLLVADGMGGHEAGEVASALTVSAIEDFVLHLLRRFSNLQTTDEQGVLKDFKAALLDANARIFEETALHPQFRGMGTTLTLAFVSNWKLFVLHAGDSRCYLLRGGQLRQLTVDHTWVGELLRHGLLNPEQAAEHPYRHVVTNVLGGTEAAVQADVQRFDLEPGDVVLLCSDGLTDMLDDARIAAILKAEAAPQAACEKLVAAANEQGGKDNVTAIVARFAAA